MPRPSSGHALFEKLAGLWEGKETMHPSQWEPKGGEAVGRKKNRLGLGGFALTSDYEQERNGAVSFTGHGVYTYDPVAEKYFLHWFDCIGSPPEVFSGKFEGDVLILAHGGPGQHARIATDLGAPGVLKRTMEMAPDGVE